MICSSVNRERFIVRTPSKVPDSTHFWRNFRGSGHGLRHRQKSGDAADYNQREQTRTKLFQILSHKFLLF
jgi:hypothetical protein